MDDEMDKLAGELEEFSKALAPDGAADDDQAGKGEDDAGAGSGDGEGAGGDDDGDMEKSLTLADGRELSFVDGTALMKSLGERVDSLVADNTRLVERNVKVEKVLGQMFPLMKSLHAQMGRIAAGSAGRRSVLTVAGKEGAGAAAAAGPDPKDPLGGMSRGEFMEKADAIWQAGGMTGQDITRIEAYANAGKALPPDLHSKIFKAAGA